MATLQVNPVWAFELAQFLGVSTSQGGWCYPAARKGSACHPVEKTAIRYTAVSLEAPQLLAGGDIPEPNITSYPG